MKLAIVIAISGFGLIASASTNSSMKCPNGTQKVIECAKAHPTGHEFIDKAVICFDGQDYGLSVSGPKANADDKTGGVQSPEMPVNQIVRMGATTYEAADDSGFSLIVSVTPTHVGTLLVPVSNMNGKDKKVPVKMECHR